MREPITHNDINQIIDAMKKSVPQSDEVGILCYEWALESDLYVQKLYSISYKKRIKIARKSESGYFGRVGGYRCYLAVTMQSDCTMFNIKVNELTESVLNLIMSRIEKLIVRIFG